jgi:hypothetical protein
VNHCDDDSGHLGQPDDTFGEPRFVGLGGAPSQWATHRLLAVRRDRLALGRSLRDLVPFGGALPNNPDFQEGVLNVNVVLRWEYRLGSTLFLAPASDVFLVKLSYWWG